MRVRPPSLHLHGSAIGVPRASHPDDDPFGEEHPDLLVVVELGMTLDLGEGRRPCLLVPGRIEVEAVAEPEPVVTLRPEVRPRPGQREIDIEDDCAKRGPRHESPG